MFCFGGKVAISLFVSVSRDERSPIKGLFTSSECDCKAQMEVQLQTAIVQISCPPIFAMPQLLSVNTPIGGSTWGARNARHL